jgi:hypothetical protein
MRDKEFCQRYYLLPLLSEISQIGIEKGKTSKRTVKLKELCNSLFDSKIKEHSKDKVKMHRRCFKSGILRIYDLFTDKQTNHVNTHKLVMALHLVCWAMKEDDLLEQEIEDLVEEFLRLAREQEKTFDGKDISDKDWEKLKISADKKVDDFIEILRNI